MKNSELANYLQSIAPLSLQESYDNCGLLVGNPENDITGVLVTLDITLQVVNEAIGFGCNFILAHHPVIFQGLKKITSATEQERIIVMAIKNDIAIYAMHTNADSIISGVNKTICEKIGLKNLKILQPSASKLCKLVTFVPDQQAEQVRQAIFQAGAGVIGNYEQCSFNCRGSGSFKGNELSQPFAGQAGQLHFEEETRIETIFPSHLKNQVINALLKSHPYEEVAYDIYNLENIFPLAGAGMTGVFENAVPEKNLLALLKEKFGCKIIRHSVLTGKPVKMVAVCGGSGAFLIHEAINAGADAFVTADVKYHQFFDAEKHLLLADIGHYESEQYIKDFFYDIVSKKLSNFAVHISKINTNPINYY